MAKPITTILIVEQIQSLRRQGYSIPEISRICKISKSTALRYAKNVTIEPRSGLQLAPYDFTPEKAERVIEESYQHTIKLL